MTTETQDTTQIDADGHRIYVFPKGSLLAADKPYYVARTEGTRDVKREHIDFGVKDEKRRAIGANITTGIEDVVEYQGKVGTLSRRRPGSYLVMTAQATRDGKRYGAAQSAATFETEEARQEAITKYLKDAKKRAAKKTKG